MKKIILGLMILCLMATAAFAVDNVQQTVNVTAPQVAKLWFDWGAEQSEVSIALDLGGYGMTGESNGFGLHYVTNIPNCQITAQALSGFSPASLGLGVQVTDGQEYSYNLIMANGALNGTVTLASSVSGSGDLNTKLRADVESWGISDVPATTYTTTIVYTIATP